MGIITNINSRADEFSSCPCNRSFIPIFTLFSLSPLTKATLLPNQPSDTKRNKSQLLAISNKFMPTLYGP